MKSPLPARSFHSYAEFQNQRVKQILVVLLVTLTIATALNFIFGSWMAWASLASSLVLTVYAYQQARLGHTERASTIMLVSVYSAMILLIVTHEGIRDEAFFAIPSLLILASMVGRTRLMMALVASTLLVITTLAYVNISGLHHNELTTPTGPAYINVAIIILVTAISMHWLASDLRRTMTTLELENARVLASQQQISYLAQHDALTHLPNRVLMRDRFDHMVKRLQRSPHKAALFFFDLDHFKTINDSLGHSVGDQLLCEIARQLRAASRASDTLCRLGGDEFLLLVEGVTSHATIAAIADQKVQLLSSTFRVGEFDLTTSCSLGIATYPDDGNDFESLLKKADIAMYAAKASGRNHYRFFDEQMNASISEQVQLTQALRQALSHQQLSLQYQPKFDLATQSCCGFEALLRWQHPQRGAVSPAQFIPLAESSGLIVEIGAWVLQQACAQLAQWHQDGGQHLTMAVNLSVAQIKRGHVVETLAQLLQRYPIPPSALQLELTESLLIDDSGAVAQTLEQLHQMGIALAIDDFGTGYSNLGYLKRFHVQCLKIDRSFVRHISEGGEHQALINAIIQMAHSLNLDTVAEGIEDDATLAVLRRLGCQQGQGYLWSPAVSPERVDRAWLTAA